MKTKLTLLILLVFAGTALTVAQETPPQETPPQDTIIQEAPPKQKKSTSDKLYFGGYFNMSFGQYTVIGVEPMIGYKIIPRLSVGAKVRYDYMQDKRYDETYTSSGYGASVFSRLILVRGLYGHIEYAGYNYEFYYEDGESEREWVPFLLLGAGYTQRMGKRASLNAQVLLDVLQNDKSPYSNWEPFYSVGIGVGF